MFRARARFASEYLQLWSSLPDDLRPIPADQNARVIPKARAVACSGAEAASEIEAQFGRRVASGTSRRNRTQWSLFARSGSRPPRMLCRYATETECAILVRTYFNDFSHRA
jgi:hypothetical protein